MPIPEFFLDTSALFAGIWSATGGARMLLKLGEAQAVQLQVSSQVLTEIENVVRRKAPQNLGALALLLDRSRIRLAASPSTEEISRCEELLTYRPDAIVLAAAWKAQVDFFVTLDGRHFLNNQQLHALAPFKIGTPGTCLAWYRDHIVSK
ncbi:MAG: PIN domain-containing protein [Chloroflexota bacterium]